jgi:hypothetical protein
VEALVPGSVGVEPWRGGTPGEHRAVVRLTPGRRATDSGEVSHLVDGRPSAQPVKALYGGSDRSAEGAGRLLGGSRGERVADVMEVAGVERRYDFVRRERL